MPAIFQALSLALAPLELEDVVLVIGVFPLFLFFFSQVVLPAEAGVGHDVHEDLFVVVSEGSGGVQ